MRIGMVGDDVAGLIPLRDEVRAFGLINAFSADEESGFDASLVQCAKHALVDFLPG